MLASGYLQLNLVADQANTALVQDSHLVNAAGAALNANGGDLFIANQATGVATLYLGAVNGSAFEADAPIISIPGGGVAGAVTNGTPNFVVHSGTSSGPASLMFDSNGGTISGWNQGVPPPAPSNQAQTALTTTGAAYTGLALGNNGTQNLLYAADFHDNRVDVFDGNFNSVNLPGGFTDPNLPAGFAPYNIANLGGRLLVSYAQQDAAKQNPVAGPGAGFVDAYNYNGVFQTRLISGGSFSGPLNVPWGMALAPAGFGDFSGDLLVANQGDGAIRAFDSSTGALQGALSAPTGQPLVIDGLRGLQFGNGLTAGSGNALLVTSGPNGGQHGLLSELVSAQGVSLTAQGTAVAATVGSAFSGTLAVFADALNVPPSSFSVSINWGDGTTTSGTVSSLARGYAVTGSHIYGSSGLKSISIHINDPMNHSATANSLAKVAQPGVVASGVIFTPTEGAAFSGTVATFTDGDGNTSAAPYNATITWGDGTTTAGTIAASGGGFVVQGQHTYAEEGIGSVTVNVTDTDGSSATALSTANVADAAITGVNRTLAITEQTSFSGTVASFSDTDPAAVKGDFTATIDWGDGTTTAGTISAGSGDFSVSGSHTFADEEAQNITVIVKDAGGSNVTIATVVQLADADMLAAAVSPVIATEGVHFSGTVATLSDTITSTPAGDFAATIDWGDGTTTSGTITGSAGAFTVQGSHTYAEEGVFTLTASVSDVGGTAGATAQQIVAVTEHDALSIAAISFTPTEGLAFNGAVATVSNTDTTTPASDFVATINWGDGATTTGTITSAAGQFTISGNHTYAEEGANSPVVAIAEDAPGTASATATLSTVVTDAPLNGTPVTVNLSEGVAFSGVLATVTDTNPNGSASELTAAIDWGDGTTSTGTVAAVAGGLQVTGSHTYAEGGTYQPLVTVKDTGGASVVVSDAAIASDYPLTATGATITLHEKSTSPVTVAAFTESDPDGGSASEYTATIIWGDGVTSTGIVSGTTGSYQVSGTHAYADEGQHTLTVVVRDAGGSSSTASSVAVVTEALLSDDTAGTANTRWVNEAYGDLLHRAAEPAALIYWAGRLTSGESRSQIAATIETTAEYRGDEVNQIYEHYLRRPADPGALSFGTNYLSGGNTIEQLTTIVAGSSEYFHVRGGGTNDGFLTAFYQDALTRPIDVGARQYFDHLLATGTTRSQVAAIVLASDEYLGELVAGIYLDFLERPVDAGAKSFWTSQLQHGARDEQVIATVVASDEYFAKTSP